MSRGGRPRNTNGSVYRHPESKHWWLRYRDRDGQLVRESGRTTDREEAEAFLRSRLNAMDDGSLAAVLAGKRLEFNEWADWFLERRSKPPYRTAKTHREKLKALKSLRPVFGKLWLSEITPESIEDHIEQRLSCRRKVHTKLGIKHLGTLKPATVHQEFRVLRRILNLAVKHKRLGNNPCSAVEFPVRVKGSTRKPHYMTASEQKRIEFFAPAYLRHAVIILVEMGLRPYKGLFPMRKDQVDVDNGIVHIPDSKTENGIADMAMTEPAWRAFREQFAETERSEYLFPSPSSRASKPYIGSIKRVWQSTLRRAEVPYFSL